MKTNQYLYLNRRAILAAMISAAFPAGVYAAAGKVQYASAGGSVQSADGTSKVLAKGMDISQGDTILTGPGRAQVRFTDGGYMSFQPNTQFKVEEYNYNGKQDGTEKGFFSLVQGGLRAITGLVGRENRPAYRMSTPVATIGIRGSYFLAEFNEKLRTHVGHGSIFVFNNQGNIILFEGQGAEVLAGGSPTYSDDQLTLGAKGPEGAQPKDVQEDQQAESEMNDRFKVAEQYDSDGRSNSAGNNITATIANLNAINAQGVYRPIMNAANNGTNGTYNTKINSTSILNANFGNYTLSGNIGIDYTYTGTSGGGNGTMSSGISGSILPSASFTASGTISGGICSLCSLTLNGAFSGPQAHKANVNYNITGASGGTVNGGAGFIANPPPAP